MSKKIISLPPRLFAASLRLPEKYCYRTSRLIDFSAFPRFLSGFWFVSLPTRKETAFWTSTAPPTILSLFVASTLMLNCCSSESRCTIFGSLDKASGPGGNIAL
ncbi:hypothetical protein U1Q18_005179 [Sarracenia purpurea var. burkii]